MRKRIAVIGSDGAVPYHILDIAEKIGGEIAKAQAILICGGRSGVMEAACRGAKMNGGLTVGILPSLDGLDANRFIDVAITTGIGYARNSIVVSSADAVIAIHGSSGTLSEIAMARNFLKPVFVVKGSGGVSESIKYAFTDDDRLKGIVSVSPEDAVKNALEATD